MSYVINPYVFGESSLSYSFVDYTEDQGNQTTYTFSSHAIGSAAQGRRVLVGVHLYNGSDSNNTFIRSVTVGGNDTLIAVQGGGEGGNVRGAAGLVVVQVDSGSTADIVVTASEACDGCAITVWSIYGLDTDQPHDVSNNSGNGQTTRQLTLDAAEGGLVFGTCISREPAAFRTTSWTDDSSSYTLIEDVDESIETTPPASQFWSATSVSAAVTSDDEDTNITATFSAQSFSIGIVGISFKPPSVTPVNEIDFTNTANPPVSTANSATHTFSSQALGNDGDDRVIVVAVSLATNTNFNGVDGVTVDDVECAMVNESYGINSGLEHGGASLWYVTGVSSTSGDIVVTLDGPQGNNRGVGISVFNLLNADSTVYDTNTDNDGQTTIPQMSIDLNTVDNGVAIAACGEMGSTPSFITFTGIKEVTELTNSSYRGAHAGNPTLSGKMPFPIDVDVEAGGFGQGAVAASWRPVPDPITNEIKFLGESTGDSTGSLNESVVMDLGDANPGDKIVLSIVHVVWAASNDTLNSVTFDGVTPLVDSNVSINNSFEWIEVYYFDDENGIIGGETSIDFAWSTAQDVLSVAAYRLTNAAPGGPIISSNDSIGNPTSSLDLDTINKGMVIGSSYQRANSDFSGTWTGLDEDIEIFLSAQGNFTHAHKLIQTQENPRTVSMQWSSGGLRAPISLATVFAPSLDYISKPVEFDGTNDYLLRGGDLTGSVNRDNGTISAWLRFRSLTGGGAILYNEGERFSLRLINNKRLTVRGLDIGGTVDLDMENIADLAVGVWYHVLASWDLSTGTGQMYINDLDERESSPILNNDLIDYTRTNWSVGASQAGTLKADVDIADLWFTADPLDLDIESNRRKFITEDLKPVYLGPQGQNPLGTVPFVYFSGPTPTWHTNKGSGGGFSETGAISLVADSPSDDVSGNDSNTVTLLNFNNNLLDTAIGGTIPHNGTGFATNINNTIEITNVQKVYSFTSSGYGLQEGILFDPHSDFALGSDDFTIDFWYKSDGATSGHRHIIGFEENNRLLIATTASSVLGIWVGSGAGFWDELNASPGTTNIMDQFWHHIMVVRNGDDIYGYVDGVREINQTLSASFNIGGDEFRIGQIPGETAFMATGFLDQFRISNVARQTAANFPVPSKPYGVETDENYEVNALTFNGSDEYLSHNNDITGSRRVGTFFSFVKRGSIGTRQDLFSWSQDVPIIFLADNTIRVFIDGQTVLETTRVFDSTSDWFSICLSWDTDEVIAADRVILEIDGIRVTGFDVDNTSSVSGDINGNRSTDEVNIGKVTGGSNYFDGRIAHTFFIDGQKLTTSDFAEIVGTSLKPKRYEKFFTVGGPDNNSFYLDFAASVGQGKDSSGLGNNFTANNIDGSNRITNDSPVISSPLFQQDPTTTRILLNMEGTDASTSFEDSSLIRHTVTANGNAQIDTAEFKLGVSSALFDGTGDFLTVPSSSAFDLGTGDFTVDFWTRFTTTPQNGFFFAWDNADEFQLEYLNNQLNLTMAASANTWDWTPIGDTWYHIALVRTGSVLKLFVDGHNLGDMSNSGSIDQHSIHIGSDRVGTNGFSGHIDKFRIRSTDKYVNDFQPETSPGEIAPVKVGTNFRNTTESTSTFSSVDLGDPTEGEYVLVAFGGASSGLDGRTLNSATIDGVSATIVHAPEATITGGGMTCGFIIAQIPSSSSGNIVFNFDNNNDSVTITVYRLGGISSTTAHDTATDNGIDPSVSTIDVPAGGILFSTVMTRFSGTSCVWTGVREDSDFTYSGTGIHSSGHKYHEDAKTNTTVTANTSDNEDNCIMSVISFPG